MEDGLAFSPLKCLKQAKRLHRADMTRSVTGWRVHSARERGLRVCHSNPSKRRRARPKRDACTGTSDTLSGAWLADGGVAHPKIKERSCHRCVRAP